MHEFIDRFKRDPLMLDGQTHVKGTRITVYQIVAMLAGGDTIEDLLVEYPSLTREDVLMCLDYAAELVSMADDMSNLHDGLLRETQEAKQRKLQGNSNE